MIAEQKLTLASQPPYDMTMMDSIFDTQQSLGESVSVKSVLSTQRRQQMIRKPGSKEGFNAHAIRIMEDLKEEEVSEDSIKVDDCEKKPDVNGDEKQEQIDADKGEEMLKKSQEKTQEQNLVSNVDWALLRKQTIL